MTRNSDERRHAPRRTAENRPEQEQPDADDHDRLAPERVGQLRVDRNSHGLNQHVHREQPRERGRPADVVNDRRNRGRDDRAVDGNQRRRQHQGDQDGSALGSEPYAVMYRSHYGFKLARATVIPSV